MAMLSTRQTTSNSNTNTFLSLIATPFASTVNRNAVLASLVTSLVATVLIAALFCLLRPHNSVVYAPRAKYANKVPPPPAGRGLFTWIVPVYKQSEAALIDSVGIDATLFVRFTKMCRNIFLSLSVVGCGVLIPVNILGGRQERAAFKGISFFNMITPQYMYGNGYWAFVVCAYLFDVIIFFFLWTNYRAVIRLRKQYYQSPEYQQSLCSRTLLLTDIPREKQSNQGIVSIAGGRPAIGRDVSRLTELVEKHEKLVRELETVLSKFFKKQKGRQKIDELSVKIKRLEESIMQARSDPNSKTCSYGFSTFDTIDEAEARASNKSKTNSSQPDNLIWKNLGLSRSQRRRNNLVSNLWVILLTIIWVAPNVFIAVFLANLSNLGLVWPAFHTSLEAHSKWWAVVQGVVSPAITTLFYFYLPAIFRRLYVKAGDFTKTSRERHVMRSLYTFFVFNNLIVFSLFAAVWGFIAAIINTNSTNALTRIEDSQPFSKVMTSLINVSPYWMAWLLQRNLGAAVDLAQLFSLIWGSLARRFSTPREQLELTIQRFDYAGYYTYFLFYSTVAIFFATLQPLVLPVTALYFMIDSFMKKYLIMYICVTKVESGGVFWQVLFNRFLFSTLLGNLVIALVVVAQGNEHNWAMLGSLAPLPFLILAFKVYCDKTFKAIPSGRQPCPDGQVMNPILYKPLMTPMVDPKYQHVMDSLNLGLTDAAPDVLTSKEADYGYGRKGSARSLSTAAGLMGDVQDMPDSTPLHDMSKSRYAAPDVMPSKEADYGYGRKGSARSLSTAGGFMGDAQDMPDSTPLHDMSKSRYFYQRGGYDQLRSDDMHWQEHDQRPGPY